VQAHLASEGDNHEELFVGATLQLRLGIHALRPCFLADGAAAVGFIFVEGGEFAEVDLFVEDVLERGSYVIGVVVNAITVVVVFVVAVAVVVGHGCWAVLVMLMVDGGGGVASGDLQGRCCQVRSGVENKARTQSLGRK
jgi:hypothetical protein